eukprot:130065-Pyramimonas_sp.AAC.1
MNGGMNAMRDDIKDVKERLAAAEGLEEKISDLELAMEGKFEEAKKAHEALVLDMDLRVSRLEHAHQEAATNAAFFDTEDGNPTAKNAGLEIQ